MKNENRQFDAQEQQMEEALSRALSDAAKAPEGLADRVTAASSPLLVQGSEFDALLALATNAEAPEGLADRVMAASVPLLAQTSAFEELLEAATKVEVPEGLADRVMSASLKELRGESPVIGRVGFALKMQRRTRRKEEKEKNKQARKNSCPTWRLSKKSARIPSRTLRKSS